MDQPTAPPPTAAATKLRLMCSYGGQIVPRPNTKTLFYAGGDTRIITVPAANNLTLSSLTAHLAAALRITFPFSLKYQLPDHDLDSLISLSTDEDIVIMLEEHNQLQSSNRAPHRIKLFVFPTTRSKPAVSLSQATQLKHPKTESWFVDTLKNAKIMLSEGNGSSNVSNSGGSEVESLLLETTSSFGSTSSSVSSSNLPVKGVMEESNGAAANDYRVTSGTNQDPVAGQVAVPENKISPRLSDSDCGILGYTSTAVEMHKTFPISDGFPGSLQFDGPQQVQFVQPGGSQYLPQNPGVGVPMSSYYVMNSPMPQQQQYYQTNEPHLMYFVPAGQPYNLPVQSGLVTTTATAPNRPPLHPNSSLVQPSQVTYKVVAASPAPELASHVYKRVPMASTMVNVSRSENGGLPPMNGPTQPIDLAAMEAAEFGITEAGDDHVRAQIYKSQPPPPLLPSD